MTTDGRSNRKKRQRNPYPVGAQATSNNHFRRLKLENPEKLREIQARAHANSRGKRRGIPDGWGGKPEELSEARAEAHRKAAEMLQTMKEREMFPTDDDGRAEAAMKAALEVMYEPGEQRTKLAAAKTILEFTKQKPASTSNLKVSTAEDFLAALAQQERNGG